MIEDRNKLSVGDFIFVLTCTACPEQYDVFDLHGNQVAYVRLRFGNLYAKCPDYGDHEIYQANPNGSGCFANDEERQYHLSNIAKAISSYYQRK